MARDNSLDPRYHVNIRVGMHVMIEAEDSKNCELTLCLVKEIITKDPRHESGIKVKCENGRYGRVKFIGEEAEYRGPDELLTLLEKRLRLLIEDVLTKTSPNWWKDRISDIIQNQVDIKIEKDKVLRKLLDIQQFSSLEQTSFIHLQWIIIDKKNYEYFKQVFGDDKSTVSVKLSELAHLRNIYAHNKDLTNLEKQKIRVYYHDIDYQLNRYYKNL